MLKKNFWFFLSVLASSFCMNVYSQSENIENHEIKVVKDYNVTIEEDAQKIKTPIEYYPQFKAESEIKTLEYKIPQEIDKLKFVPKSISPIGFQAKKDSQNNFNFLKVGMGTFLNPHIEWSHVNPKKDVYRFYALHNSNWIEDRKFQKSSNTVLQYSQNFIKKNLLIKPTITYGHIYSNFYGNLNESSYQAESGRQNHLGSIRLDIDKLTKDKFNISNTIYGHFNQDNLDAHDSVTINREIELKNVNDISYKINENLKLGNITTIDFNSLSIDSSQVKWYASIKPYVNYKTSGMTLVGGLEIPHLSQYGNTEFLFLPHLETYLRIIPNSLYFYSAWKRNVSINKMYDHVSANNFITINPKNLPISKQEIRKAGVHIKVKKSNWNLFFAQILDDDLILWKNDETNSRYLSNVVETNMRTNSLNIENSTVISKKFSAVIKGAVYQYETDRQKLAYNLPQYEVNVLMNYDVNKKLNVALNSLLIGGSKTIIDSQEVSSPIALNLGLSSEYNFYKNLFIFAQANNILDARAERSYGFPILGRNALIGLRMRY